MGMIILYMSVIFRIAVCIIDLDIVIYSFLETDLTKLFNNIFPIFLFNKKFQVKKHKHSENKGLNHIPFNPQK